ncbi:MAG: glycosyltransferase family 4 protein [Kineosporiaceae bacterium]
MRVLAVHPSGDLYGADRMLVKSLIALASAGHQVRVLVAEDGPLLGVMREQGLDAEVMDVPILRKSLLTPKGALSLLVQTGPALARIRGELTRFKPDVVYVNTVTLPHWLLGARVLGRVKVACHVRELEDRSSAITAKALLAPLLAAHAVIANSRATRDFTAGVWGRLRSRTAVVYNGFDIPDAPPVRTPQTPPRVVVVGRLSPRKGQDTLLDAFAEVVHRGRDAELHLIGSTFRGYEWFEDQLRERARALGIAERVRFRGYCDGVVEEFAAAAVAVVPSRIEPFGSVAVEAQLAGSAVVVSAVGGLPEIVSSGRTGLVVPPDSVPALTEALDELLAHPDRAAELGRAGQEEARRRFTRDRYDRELIGVLAGLVTPRTAAAPLPGAAR